MAKWVLSTLLEEASKYVTKQEFRKHSKSAYNRASQLGILNKVCEELSGMKMEWTYNEIYAEALKYSFRSAFQKGNNAAYIQARRKGILNEVCRHMQAKPADSKWNEETILVESSKYSTRSSFVKGNGSAYKAAKRLNILDKVCMHMEVMQIIRTDEELHSEALKYTVRSDFQYYSKGAYIAASRRGLLKGICSHMTYKSSATNLKEPMYMYYIKITTLNNSIPSIWKIGITKHVDILRRFKREYSICNTDINVLKTWYFNSGYEVANAEKNVINTYSAFNYSGCSPLRETGTTEMFVSDILTLEEV